MSSTLSLDPTTRRVPPMGGFSLRLLTLETRRILRNKRTLFFALAFPTLMFLLIVGTSSGMDKPLSDSDPKAGNIAAYVMVSMAFYGAALVAAAAGASVSVERALGWSRQLRVTPLRPVAYISIKAIVAGIMGLIAVVVVNLVGLLHGTASMPAGAWLECAVLTLLAAMVFPALGLFIGYLVPSENAMQILGPGLAAMAFVGNVFIPVTKGTTMWHIAAFTPMFGGAELARAPLTHDLPWYAVLNVVVYLAIFVAGAAWRMSKDTARV